MDSDCALVLLGQALNTYEPLRPEADPSKRQRQLVVLIRYNERLAEIAIEPSIGSKDDNYGSALAALLGRSRSG